MPRYIDADRLEKYCRGIDATYNDEPWMLVDILSAINDMPTVDAKPVVHGEWIDRYGNKYANHLYECSVCKNPALYMPVTDLLGTEHILQATTLYCPYCGAKMDLEE